jgi:hypothetical protein
MTRIRQQAASLTRPGGGGGAGGEWVATCELVAGWPGGRVDSASECDEAGAEHGLMVTARDPGAQRQRGRPRASGRGQRTLRRRVHQSGVLHQQPSSARPGKCQSIP